MTEYVYYSMNHVRDWDHAPVWRYPETSERGVYLRKGEAPEPAVLEKSGISEFSSYREYHYDDVPVWARYPEGRALSWATAGNIPEGTLVRGRTFGSGSLVEGTREQAEFDEFEFVVRTTKILEDRRAGEFGSPIMVGHRIEMDPETIEAVVTGEVSGLIIPDLSEFSVPIEYENPNPGRFEASEEEDVVNFPKHYMSHPSGVECIQITEHMSFTLGNALKYIWRADLKNDAIEDLRKARFYLDREIAKRVAETSTEE